MTRRVQADEFTKVLLAEDIMSLGWDTGLPDPNRPEVEFAYAAPGPAPY